MNCTGHLWIPAIEKGRFSAGHLLRKCGAARVMRVRAQCARICIVINRSWVVHFLRYKNVQ